MLRAGPYGDGFDARPDGFASASRRRRTGSISVRWSRGCPEALRTASGQMSWPPSRSWRRPRLRAALERARASAPVLDRPPPPAV